MRSLKILVMTFLLIGTSVCSVVAVQPSNQVQKKTQIPVRKKITLPQGTRLVSELNISQNNLLGMVERAIPAFAIGLSGRPQTCANQPTDDAVANAIKEIVGQIKLIRIARFDITNVADKPGIVQRLEVQVPESQNWEKMFYCNDEDGLVAVYSNPEDSYVALIVPPTGKSCHLVEVCGYIDVPKLSWCIGNLLSSNDATIVKAVIDAVRGKDDKPSQAQTAVVDATATNGEVKTTTTTTKTVVTIQPDGTKIIDNNGSIITIDPDGKVTKTSNSEQQNP